MNCKKLLSVISVVLCFVLLLNTVVFAIEPQPDATGDTVSVVFFAFFRSEPNLSANSIKRLLWYGKQVKVLDYSGSFVYVEDTKNNDKGYVHKLLLNDKPLNVRQQYVSVYKDVKKGWHSNNKL